MQEKSTGKNVNVSRSDWLNFHPYEQFYNTAFSRVNQKSKLPSVFFFIVTSAHVMTSDQFSVVFSQFQNIKIAKRSIRLMSLHLSYYR